MNINQNVYIKIKNNLNNSIYRINSLYINNKKINKNNIKKIDNKNDGHRPPFLPTFFTPRLISKCSWIHLSKPKISF